jgi:hypothetical protein
LISYFGETRQSKFSGEALRHEAGAPSPSHRENPNKLE